MTPEELSRMVLERRCVVSVRDDARRQPVGWARRPIPAAVVEQMPFIMVMRALPRLSAYPKMGRERRHS